MALGGWMGGWVGGRAGFRIAYSNQKMRERDAIILFHILAMIIFALFSLLLGQLECNAGHEDVMFLVKFF